MVARESCSAPVEIERSGVASKSEVQGSFSDTGVHLGPSLHYLTTSLGLVRGTERQARRGRHGEALIDLFVSSSS